MSVVNMLEQLFVIFVAIVAAKVLARVERHADARHVVAQVLHGVGIFAQAADLRFDGDAHSSAFSDGYHALQMFHFLIEGGPVLAARDGDRHDLGRFR